MESLESTQGQRITQKHCFEKLTLVPNCFWLHINNSSTTGIQGGFSKAFCKKVEDIATLNGGLSLEEVYNSQDGTQKLIFKVCR